MGVGCLQVLSGSAELSSDIHRGLQQRVAGPDNSHPSTWSPHLPQSTASPAPEHTTSEQRELPHKHSGT